MRTSGRGGTRIALVALVVATLVAGSWSALAHPERKTEFPAGTGSVPQYRTDGPAFVVCKPDSEARILALQDAALQAWNLALLDECAYEHIQAAIDDVPGPGHRILVLPGLYREEPSLAPPTNACAAVAETLGENGRGTYEQHHACPHLHNLIAVMGDDPADADRRCTTERLCRLQIEGTGAVPHDVVIDGEFKRLNVIRIDRGDGFYLRNLLVQRSDFNSVYALETDGVAFERVVTRYNDEYGFLTFSSDHVLYKDCEAYGNGDAGVYPGSSADGFGLRFTTEIVNCVSHHNMAGYSGTAGNSVWVHHSVFHSNGIGMVTDSFIGGHPGMPQDSALFEHNLIYGNNKNFYDNMLGEDPPCERPLAERDWSGYGENAVCPTSPVPVGTGIMIAGGNANVVRHNRIWDQWRNGVMLFGVPAPFRGEEDPDKFFDTSHGNRFYQNVMGLAPDGTVKRNGVDFWWDDGGRGNCWANNHSPLGITSDPPVLPPCWLSSPGLPPNPVKLGRLAPCAFFNEHDNHHPFGCDWMDSPPPPA